MKNKKVLLIIIIFLIIILVGFAGVYAYIALDIFKSPKQLFAKYVDNQYEQIKNINMGAAGVVTERMKTEVSQTEYDIKIETDTEDTMQIKGALKTDPNNYVAELTLKVNQNDAELANYSLVASEEKIALKIPELNEKYFSIKLDTILEKLQENINKQDSGKTVELSVEKIKEYKSQFMDLYNKYLEKTKAKLTDDKFSADKNVEVDVNGVKQTANRYTFSISSNEVLDIGTELLSEILEEPLLAEFLSEDELTDLKDSITNVKEEQEDAENKTIKVCVYEKSGSTIKVEIKSDDEVVAELMLVKASDNESSVIVNAITAKTEDGTVGSVNTMLYSINVESDDTTTITTTSSTTYNKDDIKALKEYYEDEGYYFYTEEDVDEQYKDTKTTQKVTTTLNGDTATSKLSLDLENLEDAGYKVTKSQTNYKFGDQVKISEVKDDIELEDYLDDEEKQAELVTECTQNLMNNSETLLGMLFGNFSTLSGSNDFSYSTSFDYDFSSDSNSSEIEDIEPIAITNDTTDRDKNNLEDSIESALKECLDSYQKDKLEDEDTNIGDYLTIEKISENALKNSDITKLDFVNSSTVKCEYLGDIYYLTIAIDAETLNVSEVTAYTEDEYESR